MFSGKKSAKVPRTSQAKRRTISISEMQPPKPSGSVWPPRRSVPEPSVIAETICKRVGFEPNEDQIECIQHLLAKEDMILIAKTGFGKSLIFQCVSLFHGSGSVCLLVIPLLALEDDQADRINQIEGCRACVLNGSTNSKQLRDEIKDGKYTHVLTSPEIATSGDFTDILMDSTFQDRLALIAVDEAHVIEHWTFRKTYGQLGTLRLRADAINHVPWFATSATMDPSTLNSVKESLNFADDVLVKRTSIDRPDLFYNIQPMRYPASSFMDLKYLVQSDPESIEKTIVYVDEIARVEEICRRLRQWSDLSPRKASETIVRYHSEIAEADRKRIATEFLQPHSVHRIVVATDAMGMGIDNRNVKRVVNWDMSTSLCNIMQRAGRAARGKDIQGDFIWFVPQWAFLPHVLSPSQLACPSPSIQETAVENGYDSGFMSVSQNPGQRGVKQDTNEQRRQRLPPGMLECLNADCFRAAVLKFFAEPMLPRKQRRCCWKCDPDLAQLPDILPEHEPKRTDDQRTYTPPWVKDEIERALETWREREATCLARKNRVVSLRTMEQWLLPDKTIKEWAATGILLTEPEKFAHFAAEWEWLEDYKFELPQLIAAAFNRARPPDK